jgi:hypothetical protein
MPHPAGEMAIPVQDSPGQQAAPQLGAELITGVAVGGQGPGQEPCVALRDEHPDGDELVLTLTAHGRLEVDQPAQPPAAARALVNQQVLAHDLSVQQHRRPGCQHDLIEKAGQLVRPRRREAQAALLADALGAPPGHEARPVGRPPAGDIGGRQLVQDRDRLAQLAG